MPIMSTVAIATMMFGFRLYSDYLYFKRTNKSAENFHFDVLRTIDNFQKCTSIRTLRSCVYDKQFANGRSKVSK